MELYTLIIVSKDCSEGNSIVNSMSPYELIDAWLQWEGIIGYTDDILTLVSGLYNVDLNE